MNSLPPHVSPPYSDAARQNALFHYTTASGLLGILTSGQLWSTAHYCANDESEFSAGSGALSPLFHLYTHDLTSKNDPRIELFRRRGVDPITYAAGFERQLLAYTLGTLGTYITCFCDAAGQEDFTHGLLSQWRAYGSDGGYALQFNKEKLSSEVDRIASRGELSYDLREIYYERDNVLKDEMLTHRDQYLVAYSRYLDEIAKPLDFNRRTMNSPGAGMAMNAIVSLSNYFMHTKNVHFREEREYRLSLVQPDRASKGRVLPVAYFERAGLPVPYVGTPREDIDILSCLDWIIIGPASRMAARLRSVSHMTQQNCPHVLVRPSHIPFTRQ